MRYYRLYGVLAVFFLLSLLIVTSSFAEEAKKGPPEGLPSQAEFVPVDSLPQLIQETTPVYPKEAKEEKITGKVIITALIDTNGDPVKVKISKSSGNKMLDESAVAAAKQNKYKPAMRDDKPVAVWVTYSVKFALDDEHKSKPKKE